MTYIARTMPLVLNNRPVYYLIHVTGRCNAKCAHCFYWRETESGGSGEDIRFEEFEKISRHLGRSLIVNLCGGEPYLREDLCDIAHLFISNNDCRLITIPSNGLMTDRIAACAVCLCKENPETFFRFSFSLDGPSETHDTIRGVPGLFNKARQTICQVAELHNRFSNFALIVTTIFSSQTQNHILEFLDWIEENLPVDQSNVTFIRGEPRREETSVVNPMVYDKVVARLLRRPLMSKINRQTDALLSYSIFFNTLRTVLCAYQNPENRVFRCYAGHKFLVINRRAEVYPCEMLDDSWTMGNLRDFNYDINALLASARAKVVVKWIKERHCACTWECAIQASKVFDPVQWPALGMRALAIKFSIDRRRSH